MNHRKRVKENLQYFRKHPDLAPPDKNATSTVWLYGVRAVNGVAFSVYTTRPKGGHLNYAVRLCEAIKDREDIKRYAEAWRRYLPNIIHWQRMRR